MKRLVSATLALSILGSTAASAASYGYRDQGYNGGYADQYRADGYRGRHGNDGSAVVAGIGLLALTAILASQHRHHQRYHDDWRGRNGNQYRWGNGYDGASGYGHENSDNGYGDHFRAVPNSSPSDERRW